MPSKATVRRRNEPAERLAGARAFAEALDPALEVRAVVVFGSVARGDFNLWSDTRCRRGRRSPTATAA